MVELCLGVYWLAMGGELAAFGIDGRGCASYALAGELNWLAPVGFSGIDARFAGGELLARAKFAGVTF